MLAFGPKRRPFYKGFRLQPWREQYDFLIHSRLSQILLTFCSGATEGLRGKLSCKSTPSPRDCGHSFRAANAISLLAYFGRNTFHIWCAEGGESESPIVFLFGTICPKVNALGPQTITSGPPPKPSASGFGGERRRSRASEEAALAGCERCGTCADEGLGMLPNKRFCGPLGCKNSKCGHTCPACR